MIEINISGRGTLRLEHLVCDVNGTLAIDGQLLPGIAKTIGTMQDRLQFHMLTADTHGKQFLIDEKLKVKAIRVSRGHEAEQKAEYVQQLGADNVVAIGQGANDAGMLKAAGLGIAVLSAEGTAIETLLSADIVVPNIETAFELLLKPVRIIATLRK